MAELYLRQLDARRVGDFERLLSGKEFGGCYCAVWSNFGPDWEERCRVRSHENLEATRARVKAGVTAGFLLFRDNDGAVVGWTGAGPKTGFPLLKDRPGSRLGAWDDSVWAIGCLAIGFAHRGLGYARRAVELLVEEARKAGAASIEAYPIEPESEDCAYRGNRRLFAAAGFQEAGSEASGDRLVVRMEKRLSAAEAAPAAASPAEAAGPDPSPA